jgi:hypothetical protein
MASGDLTKGESVANKTIDPSGASSNTRKLMNPNAKDDPETVSPTNEQKAWIGGSGKPQRPFGPKGRNF